MAVDAACPSCFASSSAGARFCSACGVPLYRPCPACGADQHAAAAFCSGCGRALQRGAERAPAGAGDERRVVTVLFADIAGSTALGEQLDPEDVRELQGDLFALADGEVRRFGGVTEKFVGDAVLAVFGIPRAHEDDAERAVRAAIAIREGFSRIAGRVAERHGLTLGIRLGINTGEVVAGREASAGGELMVSGDAVNVSARLQQRADPGDILVGERTHAATRRVVRYSERRLVDAKGKSAPVAAWQVEEMVAAPGSRPPGGLAAPMVGRDDELAVLTALAARVERERVPRLVTLFGPAGVGKSRLLAEFVQRLPHARLLTGRCLPYGDGITYWPLAEALKTHAGMLDSDAGDVAVAKLRAAVENAVTGEHVEPVLEAAAWTIGLALPPAALSPDEVRRRLHDAWRRLFAALGRERLTLLAVEDIHWASESLLELLEGLADTPEETALLLLCPSRLELLDTRPAWGAGRANVTALTLSPLSRIEAAQLAESLLGSAHLPEEATQAILERAGGNPFFLEEILSMLIDQRALEQRNGGWEATDSLAELPLPDSVHGVIAARIDLLEPEVREALRRCAVVGRTFWPRAVDADEELLAALAVRGIVFETPTSSMAGMREFTFKHALTRDVAYDALPRHERRRWHALVALWIEQAAPGRESETAELAAYHLEQAIAYGDDDPETARKAFGLLLAAGEAAVARAALEPAAQLLARALERASTDSDRAVTLVAIGRVDVGAERYEDALRRLDEAAQLASAAGLPTIRADALGWASRALWFTGRWVDALQAADAAVAALDGLPETPALAAALARKSQLEMLRGSPDAESCARLALAVAERTGNRFAATNARINLFTAQGSRGIEPVRAAMDSVIEDALAAGAYDEAYRALVNSLWIGQGWLRRSSLEELVSETLPRLAEHAAPESYERYIALTLARFVFLPSGRWTEVDAVVARSEGPDRLVGNRLLWLDLAGGMALRRGDLATADPYLHELRAKALASEEPQRVVPMAALVVPRAALAGDIESVRAVTGTMLDLLHAQHGSVLYESGGLPIARAVYATGELDLLHRMTELGAMRDAGSPLARALSAVVQGFTALAARRFAEAVERLAAGRELVDGLELHYDAACLDLDLALAHRAGGDDAGADEMERRARVLLDELGCVNPY